MDQWGYLNPCVNSSVNRGLFMDALIACIILPSAQNMICFTKWQKVIEFIDMTPHKHLNMSVIYIYISIYNEKFSESLCLLQCTKAMNLNQITEHFKCLCLQIFGVFFQATKVYWKWSNRPVHCANKCMICSHEKLINETGFLMNLFWTWMFSIFYILLSRQTLEKKNNFAKSETPWFS